MKYQARKTEVFEIEYSDANDGSTLWSELSNPEMPDDFLQEFITHASNILVSRSENGSREWTQHGLGGLIHANTIEHLEYALELMWQELSRRANSI